MWLSVSLHVSFSVGFPQIHNDDGSSRNALAHDEDASEDRSSTIIKMTDVGGFGSDCGV